MLVDIPAGAAALGVRFGPGAAGAALGVAAHELRDRTVALEDALGRARRASWPSAWPRAPPAEPPRACWPAAVARRLDGARDPDPLVARASALLARGMPVTAASREVALTDRHLRRRFHDAVGYGPKTLQRVHAPAPLPGPRRGGRRAADLARAAAEAGYADQPHLTRECARARGPAARGAAGGARRRLSRPAAGAAQRPRQRWRNGSARPGTSSSATRSASPSSTSCTS